MKPRVQIITTAYNCPQGLGRMVDSAFTTYGNVFVKVFLHSRIPAVVAKLAYLQAYLKDIAVLPYGENRGLAKSWNEGLCSSPSAADVTIICNDDIWFTDGDIEKIAKASLSAAPDIGFITTAGWHEGHKSTVGDHGFSCVAIQPVALRVVGALDENFFPAYNEDTDYALRCKRAGLIQLILPDTNVGHLGSTAITASARLSKQNDITHRINDKYWRLKWGCDEDWTDWPNAHKHPFKDPSCHPYFIDFDQRSKPYPEHNRTDFGVVQI